ncbi:ParB/RepB/Spo0J family partition protein [Neisseriaceae bacterium TC5R-5]|nr:ParB/RepB/Spo0J family partition protein [Neisseriaceae bacterium TC5R-5]
MANTKENAFSGASDALGTGIDALFADQGAQYSLIPLDMVEVKRQIRESFEDEENTLEDLAASIKVRGLLQPILLRPTADGYQLIAGERRYRAAKLAGLEQIPAYIREMSDEEAEDAQMAENIHRKNLTQIEEAKKIQRDLDKLGSVEAVLEKHQKSRPWLSKMLSLLNLPEQAKRLVTENVSADVEVINTVKTVEKVNPVAAKELVDDLKKTRGKVNARDKATAVKEEVKPSKKKKDANGERTPKWLEEQRKRDDQIDIFTGVKTDVDSSTSESQQDGSESPLSPAQILNTVYINIFENGSSPKTVLDVMPSDDKETAEAWLHFYYDAGKQAKDVGRAVIQGFRNGQFSSDGDGAFALVAFLHGADSEAKFSLINVFGSVKKE